MSLPEGSTAYEEEHVHEVYEQIASHFSSTRYKVRSTIRTQMIEFNTDFARSLGPSSNASSNPSRPAPSAST